MSNANFTVCIDAQVFVYVQGKLVMKLWRNTGMTALFHVIPTATQWFKEISVNSDLVDSLSTKA